MSAISSGVAWRLYNDAIGLVVGAVVAVIAASFRPSPTAMILLIIGFPVPQARICLLTFTSKSWELRGGLEYKDWADHRPRFLDIKG